MILHHSIRARFCQMRPAFKKGCFRLDTPIKERLQPGIMREGDVQTHSLSLLKCCHQAGLYPGFTQKSSDDVASLCDIRDRNRRRDIMIRAQQDEITCMVRCYLRKGLILCANNHNPRHQTPGRLLGEHGYASYLEEIPYRLRDSRENAIGLSSQSEQGKTIAEYFVKEHLLSLCCLDIGLGKEASDERMVFPLSTRHEKP